jgi:peptide/nickel transport system permease protein
VKTFLLRRLLFSIFAVWAVATIVFGMLQLSGDPVAVIMAGSFGTPEYIAKLRHDLGLDLPVYQQYLRFLSDALHGDLGRSLRWSQPALPLVIQRLPATFELAVAATLFAVVVAVPAGVLSATRPRSLAGRAAMLLAFAGQAIPLFWLGIMLVLLVSVTLRLLPPGGREGLDSLILPAITLGMYPMARIARLTRSSMLDVLTEGYIVTARSKGLSDLVVVYRHALKNAAIPIVTIIGLQLGSMLGGAVITETIFAWPGIGSLSIQAIYNRDLPLVQASVIVVSVLFIIVNLTVDIAYAYLDPRIRYD